MSEEPTVAEILRTFIRFDGTLEVQEVPQLVDNLGILRETASEIRKIALQVKDELMTKAGWVGDNSIQGIEFVARISSTHKNVISVADAKKHLSETMLSHIMREYHSQTVTVKRKKPDVV